MTSKILVYFSIIALGYFLKKINFLSEKEGATLSHLIIYVTLPVVITNAITSVKLQTSLLFLTLSGMMAAFVILMGGWLTFTRANAPKNTQASLILTLCGFNLAIFAYPFAQLMWSNVGLTYMAMFDMGNALVIYTLGYSIALGYSSDGFSLKAVVKKLITFPPLIAFTIALILNFSNTNLPKFLSQLFETIGEANVFLSMLTIGVYLNFKRVTHEFKYMAIGLTLKYTIGFAVGFALYALLKAIAPNNSIASEVVLVSSVMPTPLLSLIYSVEKKLDPEIAGGMVTATVLISSLVLFVIGM